MIIVPKFGSKIFDLVFNMRILGVFCAKGKKGCGSPWSFGDTWTSIF